MDSLEKRKDCFPRINSPLLRLYYICGSISNRGTFHEKGLARDAPNSRVFLQLRSFSKKKKKKKKNGGGLAWKS